MSKAQQAETEIAVLQVKVENVESKLGELRDDVKSFRVALDDHSDNIFKVIRDLRESNSAADKALSEKISGLEKWRWMMMGAGIVMGSLGYDVIGKLLK